MGLQNLFTICYKNPGLLSSAYAFEEFQKYISNLQKYVVYLSPGIRGKIYNRILHFLQKNLLKKLQN